MQVMLPLLGGAGSLVMIVANRNPIMLVAGGIMLAAMVLGGVVAFIAQRTGSRRRVAADRSRYLTHLAETRQALAVAAAAQRRAAEIRHPAPDQLPELIRN